MYNMCKSRNNPTVCDIRLRDAGAGVPCDGGGGAAAGGDIPGHGHAGRGRGSGQSVYTLDFPPDLVQIFRLTLPGCFLAR